MGWNPFKDIKKVVRPVVGMMTGGLSEPLYYQPKKAAEEAAAIEAGQAQAAMTEQRQMFEQGRQTLQPFVNAGLQGISGLSPYSQAGQQAFQQQQAYLGLQGPEAQQNFIQGVASSPEMAELQRQSEEAILANASATGGLRGGNTQAMLSQNRPGLLMELLNQKYDRLGGLAGLGYQSATNLAQLGQASAAGQATAGLQTADALSGLRQQFGQAQAGGRLAGPQILGNLASQGLGILGSFMGGRL